MKDRPDLDALLRAAVGKPLSPRDRWEQRVSFVYGQLMDCNPEITREQIEARAVEMYGPRPSEEET